MPDLLKVLDTALLSPPTQILDTVPLGKGDIVSHDELNGLDHHAAIVIPTHLHVQWIGRQAFLVHSGSTSFLSGTSN